MIYITLNVIMTDFDVSQVLPAQVPPHEGSCIWVVSGLRVGPICVASGLRLGCTGCHARQCFLYHPRTEAR
ncbi:hypothetical protein V1477_010522 [Vespula maculifrons]|uniref:Uncharacterized protein n=1 Tax=Vespula maculifrons TaxID=7453 RepID=A0ABD2C4T0_VESMC